MDGYLKGTDIAHFTNMLEHFVNKELGYTYIGFKAGEWASLKTFLSKFFAKVFTSRTHPNRTKYRAKSCC